MVIKAPSLAHRQQGPASQSPRTKIKEEVFALQRRILPMPTPCQCQKIANNVGRWRSALVPNMLPNRTDVFVPLNGPFAEIDSGRAMHTSISVGGHEPFPAQSCPFRWPDEVPFGTAFVRAFIPCANRMRNLQSMQRQRYAAYFPKKEENQTHA